MARANPKWSQIRQDGGHVGTKLALFSVLSASGAHFSRLAAFVAPFGRFFRDSGRSSHDFGTPSWPYVGTYFALGGIFRHAAGIAAKKPCWHSSNRNHYRTLKKNYVFLIRLHNETRKRLKQHRYISIFFLASGC